MSALNLARLMPPYRTQTLAAYLAGLNPLLWYDRTPTNRGSLGSAFDATPTNVTLDANGMNFNGTTSIVVIPTGAGWVDVINSGSYTMLAIAKATTVGENSSGRLWTIGALSHTCNATTTPTLVPTVARTSPASSTMSNPITAYPSAKFMLFMGWDAGGTISGHSGKAGETALTAGTDANGSGDVTALTTHTLNLGNRTGADRTWDGFIHTWALIPRVLTLAERQAAFTLALPYLNAA